MKWLVAALAAVVCAPAAAQVDPQQEMNLALEAARKAMQAGPADVRLVDQATLHLPREFLFIPKAEASRMLRAMGNSPAPDTLGMILPAAEANWFVVARYVQSGYIKDDDAKEWNADDLLKNVREGTESVNAERKQRGIPEVEVVGWVERPAYDAATHRLVWSLSSRARGEPAGAEQGVNYNTYLLGREGYVSMNLVTGMKTVESEKPIAKQLLASVEFDRGKSYGDFNASTDHVAEYGLAALVGGVAAKKLGLFALAAAFFAKFAKVILLALIPVGALIMKLFRRGKDKPAASPPAA